MEKFYFLRDKDRKPVVTVYLIKNDIGIGKGVSICSKKDAPNKRVGTLIAKQRAEWAIKSRINDLHIYRGNALVILSGTDYNKQWFDYTGANFKSQYNPALTEYEKELLKASIGPKMPPEWDKLTSEEKEDINKKLRNKS